MRTFTLTTRLHLPVARDELFPFFTDAGNLQLLTPPWLEFHILTRGPIEMAVGTLIDYRLRIHGVLIRWRTRITCWEPPEKFVDEQLRGPYRRWVHEHVFRPVHGGTECLDHVEYAVWGGALVERLFVRRDIERIFSYRGEILAGLFGHQPGGSADRQPQVAERPAAVPPGPERTFIMP